MKEASWGSETKDIWISTDKAERRYGESQGRKAEEGQRGRKRKVKKGVFWKIEKADIWLQGAEKENGWTLDDSFTRF